MKLSDFKTYLKVQFPSIKFYIGTIDKSTTQCIGIYSKGNKAPHMAIGGVSNTSYSELPISILIHWSDDTDVCEDIANSIYESLFGSPPVDMNGIKVKSIELLDSHPVDVGRDPNNIVEMIIRLNIIYER